MEANELVEVINNQAVVSSCDVALSFGKRHSHVIRDIEAYQDRVGNWADLFMADSYPDSYGRQQKCYLMNRDGFSLLVMSFTGKEALNWKVKYINAFNRMEAELNKKKSPTWYAALNVAQELINNNDNN